jgi:hypothetical protein
LVLSLAAVAPGASADDRIGVSGDFLTSVGPGGLNSPRGIAVSKKENGDIYVVDAGFSQRVSQFEPNGAFVRAFGWGIVPGATTGTGDVTAGSASITNVVTTLGAFSASGLGGKIISGPGIPANTRIEHVNQLEIRISKPATSSGTAVPLAVTAGPGNVPVNEKQELEVFAASGEYTLTFISPKPGSATLTTPGISSNASAATVQATLEGLTNIGAGNISVTGGPGDATGASPYVVTFQGRFADTNVRRLSASNVSLSGGTPTSSVNVTVQDEGGGAVETCTTSCVVPSVDENTIENGEGPIGTHPGQLNYSDGVAVDNDPTSGSYGDIYVVDHRNFRVEKYGAAGELLLIFGGNVDKTTGADVCTAADLAAGDVCGVGVPGTGPSHFYEESPPTGGGGSFAVKTWSADGNSSIAVGPDGIVYVGDYGRVQEFEPDGTFTGELKPTDPEPQFIGALAVDSAGNLFEHSETHNRDGSPNTAVPGVREYSPAHTLLRTFDAGSEEAGSEPTHIAVDASGNLYVSDQNSEVEESSAREFVFRAFHSTGVLYAEFTSDQVSNRSALGDTIVPGSARAGGIAVGDAAERLYATSFNPEGPHIAGVPLPQIGAPTIEKEVVSDVEPTTATLNALVNPRGADTHYHFEYVDEKSFETENGFASPHTVSTASIDLGLVAREDAVVTAISGLTPGTGYRWRVVAESAEGTTYGPAEFETLTPVSITDLTTQTVGPELVTLKAELNPNGSASTYTIRIGADTSYADGESEGSLVIGNEFVPVSATFTGLEPNTQYHYQLIAENNYGDVATLDRTFTTEPSEAEERSAENCPNTGLREENNSLSLADCRAYEQVSPPVKEGAEAFGAIGLAPGGERVMYYSEGAFAGAQANSLAVQYLSTRNGAGWHTQPTLTRLDDRLTQPGAFIAEPTYLNPEMDTWIFSETPGLNQGQGELTTNGFLSMSRANGDFIPVASPTLTVQEGGKRPSAYFMAPSGSSEDLSTVFITTGSRLLSSPDDDRPDEWTSGHHTRIYELSNVGSGTPVVRLAAEVPVSLTASSPASLNANSCAIDGYEGSRLARLASADGSRIIYTAPIENAPGANCGTESANPIGLFERTNGVPVQVDVPLSSQCNAPSPCASAESGFPVYDGASPSGQQVWFTTDQPLTDSDTDNTNDVYLAELDASGEVTELVLASAGEATGSHPTPGNGAKVGEEGVDLGAGLINQGIVKMSADGSTIAFESPSVLTEEPNGLGETAVQGANNVYVFNADEPKLSYVTKVCSGPELSGTNQSGYLPKTSNSTATAANAVHDPDCPATLSPAISPREASIPNNDGGLWMPGPNVPATLTPNGRYLLFLSWGRLTPDDTDDVRDAYRYDTATGKLIRVSFGRNGNDGNGNDDRYPVQFGSESNFKGNQLAENGGRSMSADGGVVIFHTAGSLVSGDTNAGPGASCVENLGCDVYEWEEDGHGTCQEAGGCMRLISDGVDPHGGQAAVLSSSGRDIVFFSQRNLVPSDNDGVGDIYDARVDGGFKTSVPPSPCGSPEACREGVALESAAPTLGTEQFVGPGNAGQHLKCAHGRRRVIRKGQPRCVFKHHKKQRHKKHHGRKRPRKKHRNGHKRSDRRRAETNQGGVK